MIYMNEKKRDGMKVSFGESLRRLRMERSISQQQLGNLLHVDRSTIAKWESGARLPDADMIARLSDCLRAEPGSLLHAPEKDAEKWNVMLMDDEKIILGGALPVLSEALPEAEIYGLYRSDGGDRLCPGQQGAAHLSGYRDGAHQRP